MADSSSEDRLNPSELGTKTYWDNLYTREIVNHASNPDDEGTVWFDDSSAESSIIKHLLSRSSAVPKDASFLDVGTGNGHLLFELIEEGEFEAGKMVGVDYSENSIELAKNVSQQRGGSCADIKFAKVDIIKDDITDGMLGTGILAEGGFDVILDKGTFDAISLSAETLPDGRRGDEVYAEKVGRLVKKGTGILLLTSCNWTEEELSRKILTNPELEVEGTIKYRSFTFGGVKGQTISSVVFRRKVT